MTRRELVLASCSAALGGCARQGARRLVRVSTFPGGSATSLYLAQQAGYFSREGLDVEIRLTTNTPQNVPLLAREKLDAAFGALNPAFLNAVDYGLQVRIVAVLDAASPGCGGTGTIYGRRSLFPNGTMDLRALRGKRIAVSSKTGISGFFLEILLTSAGMKTEDVQALELSQSEAVAALVGGRIDATVCSHREMELDQFSAKIVRGPSVGDVCPNLQYSFAMFGPSLLRGSPDTGIRFLTAFLRGARDQRAGRIPAVLKGRIRDDDEAAAMSAEKCHWDGMAEEPIDSVSIGRFVNYAVRAGYTQKEMALDRLVDNRFWREAQQRSRSDS